MGASPTSFQVVFFLLSISILYAEVSGRIADWDYSVQMVDKPRPYGAVNLMDVFQRASRSRIQRRDRSCILNAGLSQGCDLSDMLYAKNMANKFASFAGPGR